LLTDLANLRRFTGGENRFRAHSDIHPPCVPSPLGVNVAAFDAMRRIDRQRCVIPANLAESAGRRKFHNPLNYQSCRTRRIYPSSGWGQCRLGRGNPQDIARARQSPYNPRLSDDLAN
jgi:hypothetical protein